VRYRFDSIEKAEQYLEMELTRMNKGSQIEEERTHLLPYRPPLELSQITEKKVDKYSFVRVDNNFYSVPEYLVGRKVTVRSYIKEIVVYSGLHEVCRHIKKDGRGEMSVNIFHYLDTLAKKPGAVRNSKALRSEIELKAVFDRYYTTRPREFIDILRTNKDKPLTEIIHIAEALGAGYIGSLPEEVYSSVLHHTQYQLNQISDFFVKESVNYEH
jgi:hypothetical protein